MVFVVLAALGASPGALLKQLEQSTPRSITVKQGVCMSGVCVWCVCHHRYVTIPHTVVCQNNESIYTVQSKGKRGALPIKNKSTQKSANQQKERIKRKINRPIKAVWCDIKVGILQRGHIGTIRQNVSSD